MLFADAGFFQNMFFGTLGSLVFGLLGVFLMLAGYKAFDWITPKLNVENELITGNLSVAIVVAAIIFSAAYLAAHVVH